jgi:hypothetical protein
MSDATVASDTSQKIGLILSFVAFDTDNHCWNKQTFKGASPVWLGQVRVGWVICRLAKYRAIYRFRQFHSSELNVTSVRLQNCIIVGVLANESSIGTLDPYPAGSALGFINYASTGLLNKIRQIFKNCIYCS